MRHLKSATREASRVGSFRRSTAGQSIAEFALVVPILLLLVFGIVEFGLIVKSWQVVTDAAREGARVAVVGATPGATADSTDAVAAVRAALNRGGLDGADATVTLEAHGVSAGPWTGAERGDTARMNITYPHDMIMFGPLIASMTGYSTIPIRTSIAMRKE
ncbi:MAG TPA: TadE/TadG family type IV pilus assembly protein [Longimicrobiales bacterium]|nr:TadE/TadG family type IV pilus assembly protein [Longimicrobiales bacterium]